MRGTNVARYGPETMVKRSTPQATVEDWLLASPWYWTSQRHVPGVLATKLVLDVLALPPLMLTVCTRSGVAHEVSPGPKSLKVTLPVGLWPVTVAVSFGLSRGGWRCSTAPSPC